MLRRSVTCRSGNGSAPHTKFPHLLTPLTLNNGIVLRNRVLMGSMHTGLEEAKEDPYQKMAMYFGERAQGGVGLIVTGGVAPNWEGKVHPFAGKMTSKEEAKRYRTVTDHVHQCGGKILMQILHAGRYAYCPLAVAPSPIPSPIWKFSPMKPIGMPQFWIRKTIRDFAHCAVMAKEAGFDGIELMASEGYLLNEFLVSHTNKRNDEYGGTFEKRMRFPLETLKAIRAAVGPDFIIMTRVSMLDLVPNGSSQEEIYEFAEKVAESGTNIINTGIGWHEARVPTIATVVPRAAFTWVTKRVRDHLRGKGITIPLVTTNRINTPAVAEEVLQKGEADMISMARPLLADPYFVAKAAAGREKEINICIGCNQACLDHVFKMKTASCLVNPAACHELDLTTRGPRAHSNHYIIVGGGPAGCQAAITLAEQGQRVTLYESTSRVGGQFHLAKQVPGKEEYESSIKYWEHMITFKHRGLIDLRLHSEFNADNLLGMGERPKALICASGAIPKEKNSQIFPGIEANPIVVDYFDVLARRVKIGRKVAVIGAGGIGFDVACFLTHRPDRKIEDYARTWGIDMTGELRGGLDVPNPHITEREVYMFQRSKGKSGGNLGPTTGWIHRAALKHQNVLHLTGVTYRYLDGNTLHYSMGGVELTLKDIDNVVICAGQKSLRSVYYQTKELIERKGWNMEVHLVGGAKEVKELDAKHAIRSAHVLAMRI